ncbi:MAG TPA: hypothetical protein VFX16_06435 [Pseudonocardiaceae bacterium]|nr:hypothetical protein [Pseudonocardiaceae bacterium]
MMLFRRDGDAATSAALPEPTPADEARMLRDLLAQCYDQINSNAGRIPADAVLTALHICDLLRETVHVDPDHTLDVRTVVSLERMLADYLPTTLRTYLAVGPTGSDALREQLDALVDGASDIRADARQRDSDAMVAQTAFLRTKFSGSDLDL